MREHIFRVNKQVALVYKCAILGERTSINLLLSLDRSTHMHTSPTVTGTITG